MELGWPVPAAVGHLQETPVGAVQAVFDRMPPPATGWTYRLWRVEGTSWVSIDIEFNPEADGWATVSVPGDPDEVEAVLVSPEPKGGSAQPTTDQLSR
jgi:Anti-sigma-K factor rskA